MRFAVQYDEDFRYFDKVDEVIFTFSGDGDLYKKVCSTLKRSDQTANICLYGPAVKKHIDNYIGIFLKIAQKHDLIVTLDLKDVELIKKLKENNIKFTFIIPACSFSVLKAMQLMGAYEVYIAEDICFNMDIIQEFRKQGLKIRIFPDVVQVDPNTNQELPDYTGFWVRPEDVELYEDLIDTMEIWHTESISAAFKLYKQEQWVGSLKALIKDLKSNIENTSLPPQFGPARLNCGKKCLWGKCNLCERAVKAADAFTNANIGIVKEKKEL